MTPLDVMQREQHPLHLDEIELQALSKEQPHPLSRDDQPRSSLQYIASEPSFNRFISNIPGPHPLGPHPHDLERSSSLPTGILATPDIPHPQTSYLSRPTGRLQSLDISEQETKPDLWKIAYYGMKFLTKVSIRLQYCCCCCCYYCCCCYCYCYYCL